ncbi:MAG: hypothetical protein IT532_05210 [Burkholderiales bacterium]|nr:hypothetical protein [Burkholderiales bacterium]
MFAWHKTFVISALVVVLGVPHAFAMDQEQVRREPTSGEVLVDAVIARPIGLLTTIVGAAAFVVSLPFTLPSNSVDRAKEALVVTPARYTFKRPIGQLDSCATLPESCK